MTLDTQPIHSKVQQRLQIKYVDAKQLTSQAICRLEEINKRKLTSDDDVDQVVEYTSILFNQLSSQQQSQMKIDTEKTKDNNNNNNNDDNSSQEPEWKRKARMAALKRELEWKHQQEGGGPSTIIPTEQSLPSGTQLETTKSTTTNEEVVSNNGANKTLTSTTKTTTTVVTNYASEPKGTDKSIITTSTSAPRKSTTTSTKNEGPTIQRKGKWQKVKKEDLPEGYEEKNKDKLRHVTCLCTIM
jgi:hypothetical protein